MLVVFRIFALLIGLGDDEFFVREAANKELLQLAEKVDTRPYLRLAAGWGDPETRRRCQDLLERYRLVYSEDELYPGLIDFPRWLAPAEYDAALFAAGFDAALPPFANMSWPGRPWPFFWADWSWQQARTAFLNQLLDAGWTRGQIRAALTLAGWWRGVRVPLEQYGILDPKRDWPLEARLQMPFCQP